MYVLAKEVGGKPTMNYVHAPAGLRPVKYQLDALAQIVVIERKGKRYVEITHPQYKHSMSLYKAVKCGLASKATTGVSDEQTYIPVPDSR